MQSSKANRKGLFLAFEGGEGSGKSTQATLLHDALSKRGVPAILTKEPGGTFIGSKMRDMLLGNEGDSLVSKAQALLFAADRAQHVETVIKPRLAEGFVVICDRYIASSMAYQAYAGGLDKTMIEAISGWAADDLYPDATFLLDLDPVVGLERAMRVNPNRYEQKHVSFHDKVRRGFLWYRVQTPADEWLIVDAMQSIRTIHDLILEHAWDLIGKAVLEQHFGYPRQPEFLESVCGYDENGYVCPRCFRCNEIMKADRNRANYYICGLGHGTMVMPQKMMFPANWTTGEIEEALNAAC